MTPGIHFGTGVVNNIQTLPVWSLQFHKLACFWLPKQMQMAQTQIKEELPNYSSVKIQFSLLSGIFPELLTTENTVNYYKERPHPNTHPPIPNLEMMYLR